ncbi:uncharacterized protein LOC116350425 [Contarinia nasturtii]|uniref:uncharacterized protein LOC116350425 n=1 Tax=Contarinia nasturtii TaxID=265458 RepID=UPI0012D424EC|nr:uncharacterized protein LOC116350425 [Contarinia nasturtii]
MDKEQLTNAINRLADVLTTFTNQQVSLVDQSTHNQRNRTSDGTENITKTQSDSVTENKTALVSHNNSMTVSTLAQDKTNYKQLFIDTKQALNKAIAKNTEIEQDNVELKEVINTLDQSIVDLQKTNVMLLESISKLKAENIELERKKATHHCQTCGAIHDVVIYCTQECYAKQQALLMEH